MTYLLVVYIVPVGSLSSDLADQMMRMDSEHRPLSWVSRAGDTSDT